MRTGREVWKHSGSKYQAAVVWEDIRPKQEKKDWHRMIWTALAIPRHEIISWMAVLNRLPTLDRLSAWGLVQDGTCRLCQNGMEARDHLFFSCNFSKEVWVLFYRCTVCKGDFSIGVQNWSGQ